MTAPSLELENAEIAVRATKEDAPPLPAKDDALGGEVTAESVRRSLRRWNSSDLADASVAAARRSRKIVGGRADPNVATTDSTISNDNGTDAPTAVRNTLLRSKSADWSESEPLRRPESPRRRIRQPEHAATEAAVTKFGQSVRRINRRDTLHNDDDTVELVDISNGNNDQKRDRSYNLIEV
jgi:hypothetical protein